eukprot:CAMPEP_0171200074 /NCGR_PEP_ID=MMETSP0790-20130122/23793_1 /TAXON_ID=2925 /ORGANISM="Alexandrium catenella, Strain OF101" /LENGTH=456 /DNA_ID=CAMNT_0011665443 /DNA_START=32 /DNA_END=1402 /DNA_ORIENTATION=+
MHEAAALRLPPPVGSIAAAVLKAVAFLAWPAVAVNCPYIHPKACAAPGHKRFLKLWAEKLRCWLCENVTAELAGLGNTILKDAVRSDLGVTEDFQITRPWLDTCLSVYVLAMLASTRAITMQSWRLYEFGLGILWNCDYDPAHFFKLFGVTPGQVAYVLSSLVDRTAPHPMLLGLQRPERGQASAALALLGPSEVGAGGRAWDAPLVIDVGMGLGGDSRYYLKQGFRVVAVEANPLAVDAVLADSRVRSFMATGQLSVLNAAIAAHGSKKSRAAFFVYPRRPEQSKALAEIVLDGGKEVSVRTVRCADLLRVYGQAAYMKVDVETNTVDCLESLHQEAELQRAAGGDFTPPRLISVEVEAAHLVERLHKSLLGLGYTAYKACRQFVYSPGPCEQSAYDAEVQGCGSGPFGEEAVDYLGGVRWRSLHELPNDTGFLDEFGGGRDWFDLHAKLPDPLA